MLEPGTASNQHYNQILPSFPADTERSTNVILRFSSAQFYQNLLPTFRQHSVLVNVRGTLLQPNGNVRQRSPHSHTLGERSVKPKRMFYSLSWQTIGQPSWNVLVTRKITFPERRGSQKSSAGSLMNLSDFTVITVSPPRCPLLIITLR